MNPARSDLHAVFAFLSLWVLDVVNARDVLTGSGWRHCGLGLSAGEVGGRRWRGLEHRTSESHVGIEGSLYIGQWNLSARVLLRPLQREVSDFLPARLANDEVSAVRKLPVVGDRR